MYQERINQINLMIKEELQKVKPHFTDEGLKAKVKKKVEYYRKAILYLETNPKIDFIQSEIRRMMKQIDTRVDIQEEIKTKHSFTHRSKKEEQEALSSADFKQQREALRLLQFCIQGVKIQL